MRWSTKLKQLWQEDRGVMAALVALFLTAFIGLMGAGIDLGLVYAARGEMQNAADAAAMAAAADLITDSNGDNLIETNYSGAAVTAESYVTSNKLAKYLLDWTAADLFEAGKWDFDVGDFSRTGPSGNTDDLDAARVTLNRNVQTYFTRIFGLDSVDVQVRSTGFLGCSGDGGKADLPLAVDANVLAARGQALNLNSENDENVQWTSFRVWPSNTNTVKAYIENPETIPAMNIGETLYLTNGTTTPLLVALETAYNRALANGDVLEGGYWHVKLPVVNWDNPTNGKLVGFINYKMTQVIPTGGDKGIKGYWATEDLVDMGATPGGECYGVRAGRPALIN